MSETNPASRAHHHRKSAPAQVPTAVITVSDTRTIDTDAGGARVAEMLGAAEFSSVIPCGDGRSLMLLRAGDHALLAVAFGDDSSVTLIRTYALESIRRIAALYKAQSATNADPDERIQGQRFDKEIDGALDDVFG